MSVQFRILLISIQLLLVTACASLPENSGQVESYSLNNGEATVLGKSVDRQRVSNQVPDQQSGLILLQDGVDAFAMRIAMVRLAEKSLDLQYYLYHSDLAGGLLTLELLKAAERGVRVRVLLDDMDMEGKDKDLAIITSHPNIEIRLFNPFIRGKFRAGQYITGFGSVTRRAHNKAIIADNQFGIVGGRNIGDEYFSASLNMQFGDLDVAITKPAVSAISQSFDLYWNHALAYPIETLYSKTIEAQDLTNARSRLIDFYKTHKESEYLTRLRDSDLVSKGRDGSLPYYWGEVEVYYDHPDKIASSRDKKELQLAPKLAPYLLSATNELLVISPYFVPGKAGVEFFSELENRGVDVKILTNSLMSNDVPIVHAGYSKYRKKLLQSGVDLYELDKNALGKWYERNKSDKTREGLTGSKASLHAKYFIIDRRTTFIGSLNLDPRSVLENTEIGAMIESSDMASKLAEDFYLQVATKAFSVELIEGDIRWVRQNPDGSKEVFKKEPHSSWWDRFSVGFMKWLPAESQL